MTPEHWKQIKDVFQSLVECAPSDRAARLDEVCTGDAELRRELELLLKSDEEARSFLEIPPVRIPHQSINQPLEGRTIGPYQVVSLLGRGGMGEVYQARDSRLDRTVALKILPADVADDPERMKRFVIEAKAASALSHPSVATIYDIGENDGITFIAMEYVEGQTLEQRMNGRPMSAIEIRTVARQVAEALDAAHSKGITHRDIKPANLMITARGEVKVLDFGLAKMSRQAVPGAALTGIRTMPGVLMGTIEYMSPEQALGHDVDYRTDIFSLGVVLYQMATGQSPFAAISIGETIDRILHLEPEPISQLNPRVPPELDRVIQKCLAKERDRRYSSARELLADLRESQLASASPRTIRNSILQPKWVIAFGVVGVIVWLATLALIISQRPWRTRGNETNRPSETLARSDAPTVKPSEKAAPDNQADQSDRAPTNQPGSTDTSRPSPPILAPDRTDRGRDTQAGSVSSRTNFKEATESQPVVVASDAVRQGETRIQNETKPVLDAAIRGNDDNIPTIVDTLFSPAGIAVGPEGNIYISDADGARIFKVTPSGEVLTIAGTGTPGFIGDGGPATSAQLRSPSGITLDGAGNLYVADRGNYRIRKITTGGMISTIVGNGNSGTSADGRTASSAPLGYLTSLAADHLGNVYFVESSTRVRKVTRDGVIQTVADFDPTPGTPAVTGVAVNKAGELYIASPGNYRVFKVTPGNAPIAVAGTGVRGVGADGPATSAQLNYPNQIAFDAAGNLYISDSNDRRLRKVTSDGSLRTVFPQSGIGGIHVGPTLANTPGLAVDANGDIYTIQVDNPEGIKRIRPDGGITTAIKWRGDVEPVRVGQRGINGRQISTKASLGLDGQTSYPMGTPRVVIENAARMDARVEFTPVSACKFEFEVDRAEASAVALLNQKGAGPVLNVSGELEPGTYNLVLRFQRSEPRCINSTGATIVLRYLVTVTPR
jgi:serine/threonine protein kinase/sugar lactone lactonase YvrE